MRRLLRRGPKRYADNLGTDCETELPGGRWVVARPLPLDSLYDRWCQAWDVFRGRADAVYYHGQEEPIRWI